MVPVRRSDVASVSTGCTTDVARSLKGPREVGRSSVPVS